ncbi:MAG: hypothetical protein K2X02_07435 [Alphaproteobacteria bacterium]|nr:hypothetical protein [Alphaproteobacteria bacterium]
MLKNGSRGQAARRHPHTTPRDLIAGSRNTVMWAKKAPSSPMSIEKINLRHCEKGRRPDEAIHLSNESMDCRAHCVGSQ